MQWCRLLRSSTIVANISHCGTLLFPNLIAINSVAINCKQQQLKSILMCNQYSIAIKITWNQSLIAFKYCSCSLQKSKCKMKVFLSKKILTLLICKKILRTCKGIESLQQTLIFYSLYLLNPMSQTLDISNYEFYQIK